MKIYAQTLYGRLVRAEPLNPSHYPGLKRAAKDPRIWRYMLIDNGHAEGFDPWLEEMVKRQEAGDIFPFTIIKADTGEVIGYCMFLNVSTVDERLEYGCVWYNPKYWGNNNGNNFTAEGTYLFQQFAFEVLKVRRWELRTEAQNRASNAANRAMGATFEGILRKEKLVRGKVYRDTSVWSILSEEWPRNRQKFEKHLGYAIPVSEMLGETNHY